MVHDVARGTLHGAARYGTRRIRQPRGTHALLGRAEIKVEHIARQPLRPRLPPASEFKEAEDEEEDEDEGGEEAEDEKD